MKKLLALSLAIALALSALVIPAALADEKETIRYPFMVTMNAAEERKDVEAAVNALVGDKLNINVELVGIEFGNWATQINNAFADGSLDVSSVPSNTPMAVLVDNGSIEEIDTLLNEYGQGILNLMEKYLVATRMDGVTYGLPKVAAYGHRLAYILRKDLLESDEAKAAGLTDMYKNEMTMEEFNAFLAKAKELYPDMTMMPAGKGGSYQTPFLIDTLGTTNLLVGLPLDGSTTVVNYYETKEFEDALAMVRDWDAAGYFAADPLNSQDGGSAQVGNGTAFGVMLRYANDAIAVNAHQNAIGYPICAISVGSGPHMITDSLTNGVYVIPSMSKHKEAAMKFLNELYTNPELANLVCCGIEGQHYVVLEDGTIDFYGDLNSVTTGWPAGMGTAWPNVTISRPWAPNPPDLYDQWLKTNDECIESVAFGFAFNSIDVVDEITACNNVVNQYFNALMLNVGDQESLLVDFRAALKDAGIDTIVAAKQEQLDEYLANK